jgi:hypothetical protein
MADQLIHCGKFSFLYEDGFIRYVRAGNIEILRRIYFALRDSNWTTADIVRTDERVSITTRNFGISYTATNVVDGKDIFRWTVKISGNENGEIDFSADGVALAMYNRNRAGICVLHPIRDTREKPVKVVRPDGSSYDSKFPTLINPNQPFLDITKMSWQLTDNAWAELEFHGDVFETEDQRNWSDTSFKTYSTPLSIPYPVMLKPGDKVSQRVKLSLINADNLPAFNFDADIEVTIDENDVKAFPKIGFDFPGQIVRSKKEIELLKALRPVHLRIEITPSSTNWRERLKLGLEEAALIGAEPIAHLILKDDEWVDLSQDVGKIAISPQDRKANVDKLLDGRSVSGAGFRSYFTELNRNRFDYTKVEFVIYPVSPTAHASDSLTVIENLPAQKDQVETARSFAVGKKVHVGPVSLTDSYFDPRQSTSLASGWMLASIKYLSEGGADSITMFQSHGKGGYFENDENIYPVYNVLLDLVMLNPTKVISSTCSQPLTITSFVIESADKRRYLGLINHTASVKSVTALGQLHTLSEYEVRFVQLK